MPLAFIGRRVLQSIPLILAIAVGTFVLVHIAPGDVAMMLAGEAGGTSEEILKSIRAEYGLDRPLAEQLVVYVVSSDSHVREPVDLWTNVLGDKLGDRT